MKTMCLNCAKSYILLSFIISLSQNKENYINMTINGSGKIQILFSKEKPSKVLYNGNDIEFIEESNKYYINSLENKDNIVIIKFDDTINYLDFMECYSIISIDLSNFDSSSITNMNSMFFNCIYLESINLNNFSTKSCLSMNSMFFNCFSLVSLDLKSFDVSSVEDMENMFFLCKSLKNLNLGSFKALSVKNMKFMFFGCNSLKSIDFSDFIATKVENMERMFESCELLESINLSGFDTSSTIIMSSLFLNCISLKSLDLSNLNTSNVSSIDDIFHNCYSLSSLDLSNLDISNASRMDNMFYNCHSLTFLNLTNSNTSRVNRMDNMFYNCSLLTSLDLSSFDTSNVGNMSNMFYNCSLLTSLDLSNFDTSNIENMFNMFYNCHSLTYLNLTNFKTSRVIRMDNMFYNCHSLSSLDISYFVTSTVSRMDNMFYNCYTLTSLDLTNFDTATVSRMDNMFYNCHSLTSLDLTNFDTATVSRMDNMFYNCYSLTSLDLRWFVTSQVKNMSSMFENCILLQLLELRNFFLSTDVEINNMFSNCSNLEYINIFNFNSKKAKSYDNMFYGTTDYLVYCINDKLEDNDQILIQLTSKNCSVKDCSDNWKSSKKKLIEGQNICTDNCSKILYYEYNYKCYSECPKGTNSSYQNEYLCVNISNINDDDINNKKALLEIIKEKFNNNPSMLSRIYQDSVNNFIKDIKNGNFDDKIFNLLNKENDDEDYIVYDQNIIFQITTPENQKNKEYENISTIFFDEKCQNILKEKYNISQNQSLLIFKYEYYIPDLHIPLIGYDVFNPETKNQLDLIYCENSNVEIIIPVMINESNLEKYNPDSDFYNNICKSYSNEKGLDVTIFDRKKEYNQYNMAICPSNCKYNIYNINTKKVSCDCELQTKSSVLLLEDIIDTNKLLNNFIHIKSISNIELFKCYKETLSKEGLKKNISNYILLIIITFFIISLILFFLKEYKILYRRLDEVVITKNINEVNNKTKKKNDSTIINIYNNKMNKNFIKKKTKIKKKKKISSNSINSTRLSSSGLSKIQFGKSSSKDLLDQKSENDNINIEQDLKDSEINTFSYEEALEKDKRNFWLYYLSLVKTKNLLIFTFYPVKNDYNSRIIKICLFFYSFALLYFINSLFFNDETMHKIYQDEGVFNFIYLLPKMIYSTIIQSLVIFLAKFLALSEEKIINLKKEENLMEMNNKKPKIKRCLTIQFISFFISSFISLAIYWYYLSCFGAIYKNTQIYLLKKTLTNFSLSITYPFIIYFIPCVLRFLILKRPELYYKLSVCAQNL